MVSQTFVIRNQAGLHLKPAAMLCTEAIKYKSSVTLFSADTETNAKSVLSVLSACVKCNDSITLSCDGPDEEEALENLGKLIMSGLGE
ncbi:phosphocarrier protein HPr family protein [Marvinbryantia formatexigens DSM 14469]|uniref:Phosphocarrier protein HPr family protein n=1 Tax=Marvinbryantia formatexigens DSM 14469 TaxID=478749 RepID=C6LFK5_9FIRM|nr:HPr family phosphocarrier protein [Marvinbryantia formatexigens]EET60590.1 phosphocarrier protein HPr family protein [Marvinbryantia formatexigens DSM 14469]UWO25582.1 HPr family phosphocarrier protein [Marvinbryantia formatexigens DSM 14469]SDG18772.1 phosphocarrier protein [Marvinbryantia formatexigens]